MQQTRADAAHLNEFVEGSERTSLDDLGRELAVETFDLGKLLDGSKDQIDFASRAHLSEAKAQIDKALDAPEVQVDLSALFGNMYGAEKH